jgi:hypothetical protein
MVRIPGRGVAVLATMVVLGGVAARPARADTVIYSNFGPGNGYDPNSYFMVNSSQYLGFEFTTPKGASQRVTEIEIAAALTAQPNFITLSLVADDNGTPGFGIQDYPLSDALPPLPGSVITFTASTEPVLAPDTRYWIVVTMQGFDAESEWFFNSTGAMGTEAVGNYPQDWSLSTGTMGVFAVLGAQDAVPEPNSLTLMAVAAAVLPGVGLCRTWRKVPWDRVVRSLSR